jgi:hypothetical protein
MRPGTNNSEGLYVSILEDHSQLKAYRAAQLFDIAENLNCTQCLESGVIVLAGWTNTEVTALDEG